MLCFHEYRSQALPSPEFKGKLPPAFSQGVFPVPQRPPAQLIGVLIVYSPMKALGALLITFLSGGILLGQGGPRPDDLGASPQPIGEAGVAWYTTWETALDEAKRSNRPIFFMAAAATCSGISGVF